jgi:hypothetical protein
MCVQIVSEGKNFRKHLPEKIIHSAKTGATGIPDTADDYCTIPPFSNVVFLCNTDLDSSGSSFAILKLKNGIKDIEYP